MTALWTEDTLDVEGTALPVRVYRAGASAHPGALVLHLHGGCFTDGDLECSVRICQLLAEAGAVVVSADYPLAPEHPFPAALNVSFAALSLLYAQRATWARRGARLFVAGEEAGANLATALALMARDQQGPPVAGQILLSPMVDACLCSASMHEAEAEAAGGKWADGWHRYLGTADKAAHPYAAPLGSRRLGGVAPALIVTSDDCPMRDESLAYARRLADYGVPVENRVLQGAPGAESMNEGVETVPSWEVELREMFRQFLAANAAASIRTVRA